MDLSLFSYLKSLQISRCKCYLISDWDYLSKQLEYVAAHHCLNALSELLDVGPRDEGEEGAVGGKYWKKLRVLDCSNNTIPRMDSSLVTSFISRYVADFMQTQLINVQLLDLSCNLLTKIENCDYLWHLEELNLSFNRIASTEQVFYNLGNVRRLQLRSNLLQSTEGLEKLYSLEFLDLSDNLLRTFDEILRLKDLPLLEEIWFKGNPISAHIDYRVTFFSHFNHEVEIFV